ncbi:macrolide 2'-phosphotransferase [Alkalibacterium sp. f15]|uniref:macrolide 2'-phosphotransferase n=1 Tax=Alkalibacterium sp. f15 TaxID=3414029 RepID=UPI003BF80C53
MNDLKEYTKQVAKKHGMDLLKSSMKIESMGLDFQVVFAKDTEGQDWVCRVPRRKDVFDKIKKEKEILDFISQHQSTFEVPMWKVATEDIIVYKKLQGVPAVKTNLETQEQAWVFDSELVPEAYLISLGKVLAALHALPLNKAIEASIPVQEAEDVRQTMKTRMHKIKESYDIHPLLWERWQSWVNNDSLWPKQSGLTHGDLFPGHTLVDLDYRVTGIIDWTEAASTDTSVDFTAIYLLFGEDALNKLLQSYQSAGGYVWPKMKEHIIERLATQAITIAEFAESSGMEEYRTMAQDMLQNKA